VIVAAKDKAAVDRAWLHLAGLKTLKGGENAPFCVFLFTPTPEGAYSRMFALTLGSSKTRRRAVQPGRRSFLHVEIQGEQGADGIYVGGHVTPVSEGVMTLDSQADSKEERNARAASMAPKAARTQRKARLTH
jgi:predicted PhzF superfamily epimerase YddE/YHI9